MGSSVFVNQQGWSHKGSGAVATHTAPDVCKTKVGSSVVSVSYPNTAYSSDLMNGAKTVKIEGEMPAIDGCCYSKSTGDEAGDKKGVNSGTVADKAEFANYSFDVKCEGKGVCRNADSMLHNNKNTTGINNDSSADPPESKEPPPPEDTVRFKLVEYISKENYDQETRRFKPGHEDNKPIAGRKFKIKLPDGSVIEKITDDKGIIELTGQDPHGRFEILFQPDNAKLNSRHFISSRGIAPLKRKL